jgi:hypothetical protein
MAVPLLPPLLPPMPLLPNVRQRAGGAAAGAPAAVSDALPLDSAPLRLP